MSPQENEDLLMRRDAYGWFLPVPTRWMDNDIYGHVNNVHYYSYFDTVANSFLVQECGLDMHHGDVIGYIVHSQCFYKSAIAFPDKLDGGFRVNRLGNSSVEYGIGIFQEGAELASAYGTFTHVFVDRENERPVPIPPSMREPLERMQR